MDLFAPVYVLSLLGSLMLFNNSRYLVLASSVLIRSLTTFFAVEGALLMSAYYTKVISNGCTLIFGFKLFSLSLSPNLAVNTSSLLGAALKKDDLVVDTRFL